MLKTEKLKTWLGHKSSIYCLSPFESGFISAGGDGWIVHWETFGETADGQLWAKTDNHIYSTHILEDQSWLVAGNMTGGIHWVDLTTRKNFKNSQVHQKGVFDFIQTPHHLYSLGGAGTITQWDITNVRPVQSLQISHKALRTGYYDTHLNQLFIGSSDGGIYQLDASTMQLIKRTENAHENSIFCMYPITQTHFISGGRDAQLKLWQLSDTVPTPQLLQAENAHWFTINDIALHPTHSLFATASRDKSIRFWHFDEQTTKITPVTTIKAFEGHKNSINKIWWHPDGQHLVSVSDDRTIILWKILINS